MIDASIRSQLDEMNNLAPLHNPPALAAIDALAPSLTECAGGRLLQHIVPCLTQTGRFELHAPDSMGRKLAAAAVRLPRAQLRVVGKSCRCAPGPSPPSSMRLVICHLGGGASVTATAGGLLG